MSSPTRPGAATARFRAAHPLDGSAPVGPSRPLAGPLALDVDDFEPAYLGWEIARCAGPLEPDEERALAMLAAACVASMRMGSTRVPCEGEGFAAALRVVDGEDTVATAHRLLERARTAAPGGAVGDATGDAITDAIGRPGDRKPLVVDGPWLYAERMYALEERFCARVRKRVALEIDGDPRAVSRAVAAVSSAPRPLTDEQKRAVKGALGASFSLITGGPGSGKTATAVALLRALVWTGVPIDSVAIAAPTGKAAQRLSDAIAQGLSGDGPATPRDLADAGLGASALVPQTLHRLLGWSPSRGRFARHENDPLPQRVVVVDEASMIDLAMMDRLLRALRDDARLVLLGDADQLPSVDAGAVFRDLCAGLGAARLTKNLRVAGDAGAGRIVTAARAVNAGDAGRDLGGAVVTRASVDEVTFEGVEHLTGEWSAVGEAFLERWWRVRVASDEAFSTRAARTYRLQRGLFDDDSSADLAALFERYALSRILCATRVRGFSAGADAIGDRLSARLRGARLRGAFAPAGRGKARRAPDFAPGTPVLVQRNDYERGLYNGDQGIVVLADSGQDSGQELVVAFARGSGRRQAFEAFPLDTMWDLAPAFAMTVHKAQGSEFDHVALVLPESDLPILTRELLYTAMTRARRSVLLVGDPALLACAVSRAMLRESGVAEKLKKGGELR